MTARKPARSSDSAFHPLPEAESRALQEKTFDEISEEVFKEIWGVDLGTVLAEGEEEEREHA